jgi:hypothetical protein
MNGWMDAKKIGKTPKGWNFYRNDRFNNLRKPCKGDIQVHVG